MLKADNWIAEYQQESAHKNHEVEDPSLNSSQASFKICNAHQLHIEGVKILADANRHIFGFITRGAFQDAFQAGTLIVATRGSLVVGFIRYHHRKRDLQTTLYDICVSESERGRGIGKQMIALLIDCCRDSNRATILLKCPAHLAANGFYERNGFCFVDTIMGKRQKLNVWRLDLADRGHQWSLFDRSQ